MGFWNDLLNGVLPYQGYWLPLAIGMAVGMACIFVGNLASRGKRQRMALASEPQAQHDPFVMGGLTEQRRSVRRGGNPVAVLVARAADRIASGRAIVLDRSMGGLRLAADEEIAVGTRIMVLPTNASEHVPWIEVDVRQCRVVEDSWELHCQFLRTPQWSILLLFG